MKSEGEIKECLHEGAWWKSAFVGLNAVVREGVVREGVL